MGTSVRMLCCLSIGWLTSCCLYALNGSTMSLRTVETAPGAEIELGSEEVVLYSALASHETSSPSPSAYPFSIPLPSDTPQCLHTARSAIQHTLTATLHPVDATQQKVETSIVVHTRRYSGHPHVLQIAPETKTLAEPTPVQVQIPRTTFAAGEAIPLYVTVPTPRRELVIEQGLRLRNVRAELIRSIRLKQPSHEFEPGGSGATPIEEPEAEGSSATTSPTGEGSSQKAGLLSSSHSLDLRSIVGTPGGGEVIAVSGASCRLHPTRPLQIRLVLHPPLDDTPLVSDGPLARPVAPSSELGHPESTTSCASITQDAVLHNVSFAVCAHITFMNMHSHTERMLSFTIPVAITAPTAPLPEVEQSVDAAYHKKHDRPPTRTVRQDDEDDAPGYSEGQAGPSYLNGAPPPFEEREAPPPFFPGASTSRLPTFQESETEIYVPAEEDPSIIPPTGPGFAFEGEGTLFGFPVRDQFDGFQDQQERPVTPPPTMEMSTHDPDVTSFATMDQSTALNAIEIALEQQDAAHDDDVPPPPPPALDDPSDPPPSIDSDFRIPGTTTRISASPRLRGSPAMSEHGSAPPDEAPGHAPPPYGSGVSDHPPNHDHDQVARPPPYVDLVPANTHTH